MYNMISIIQVNMIGIILMIITLFSLVKNFKSGILADRIFFLLVLSVMSVCFFEITGFVFNEQTFAGAHVLNRICNSLLFAVNPIPAFLWALYANCKIYGNEKKLFSSLKYLLIPLVMVVFASFANLVVDVFFKINADNVYQRTDIYFISTLLSLVYIAYVAIIIIRQRKNISKDLWLPLLSFMIMPLIGLVIQFLFYGISALWVSVAISIIIIFNHVQNDSSITDWLTGLYNRKHLDSYVQQMCRRKSNNMLVGFMIDIDYFKLINDTCGHMVGDQALKDVAVILKKALGNKIYIARYAGDEFVIFLQTCDKDEIRCVISKINSILYEYNSNSKYNYKISLSIGYAIYKGLDKETEDEFLSRMDKEMYRIKKTRKTL